MAQVIASVVFAKSPQITTQLALCIHILQSKAQFAGVAITQYGHAPCIAGQVAAQGAGAL